MVHREGARYRVESRAVEVGHHDIAWTTVPKAFVLRSHTAVRDDAGPHGVSELQRAHRYRSPTHRRARGLARRAHGEGSAEALVLIGRRDREAITIGVGDEGPERHAAADIQSGVTRIGSH